MSDTSPAQLARIDPAESTAQCDNCGVTLQGTFCHRCGQSRHNPTQHFRHAIGEVVDTLWDLDGRIFRTLRDVLVPGRVAIEYMAGHRARYIAPFRLFVILSLLTFFVASQVTDIDADTTRMSDAGSDISEAATVADVERIRDRIIAGLNAERAQAQKRSPVAAAAIEAGIAATRSQADTRIDQLRKAAPRSALPAAAADNNESNENDEANDSGDGEWDPVTDPIDIEGLPAFGNSWLNAGAERAKRNAKRINDEPGNFVRALIGAIPSALFLLVPVFALMLKLIYLFKRRLYLEHLVVALYSHAWILLSLLVIFLSMAVRGALPASAGSFAFALGAFEGALWLWMPVYLLLMQKRVYAQGWPMTLLKYTVIGSAYFVLLGLGAAFLFTYVLVQM